MEIIIPDPSKACQSSGMVESKSVGTCTVQQKQDGQRGHFVDRGVGSPRLVKSGSSTLTTDLNLDTDTKVCMNYFLLFFLLPTLFNLNAREPTFVESIKLVQK